MIHMTHRISCLIYSHQMLHFQSEMEDLNSRVKGMTASPCCRWLTETLVFTEMKTASSMKCWGDKIVRQKKSLDLMKLSEKKTKLELKKVSLLK